jgi:lipid-A-disaccharide synthase
VKRAVTLLLTLFPFEARLFEKEGVSCGTSVTRSPTCSQISGDGNRARELRISARVPVVAMLPGSRVSELEKHGGALHPYAVRLNEAIPGIRILVPFVTRTTKELFEAALSRVEPKGSISR